MPTIQTTTEDPIQLHEGLDFVEFQDVEPGDRHIPAVVIEGRDDHVIGIERNTPFAPTFVDENGEKLDESTRVIVQKADEQRNPLGNAIVLEANLDQFDYARMRSDTDYMKTTTRSVLLDEREHLFIYVDIPSGSNGFDAEESRITIGDNVTQTGKPVFVREKASMGARQQQAVEQASSSNGR